MHIQIQKAEDNILYFTDIKELETSEDKELFARLAVNEMHNKGFIVDKKEIVEMIEDGIKESVKNGGGTVGLLIDDNQDINLVWSKN